MGLSTGTILVSVNGVDHHFPITGQEKSAKCIAQATRNGINAGVAFRFLAEIGAKTFHPQHAPAYTVRNWEKYFGPPGSRPSGSVLGKISIFVDGIHLAEEAISGSTDKFAHEMLVAHARGENPAEALSFLADVGATLRKQNAHMLNHRDQDRDDIYFA